MFLSKLFSTQKTDKMLDMRTAIMRNLMQREAAIGGTLFGTVPKGGRREFFCLDETTWIWHEEWVDKSGQHQVRNTRYDVRPTGVLKAQNGQGYQKISREEAKHLEVAVDEYVKRVNAEIYHPAV